MGNAEPPGPNRISAHEERFPNSGTYQIATQTDNLNHVGVGDMFYNGFRGSEISRTWGTTAFGGENMGPIVTRGIVLDIVGLKVSQGATSDYFTAANGSPVLRDNYRVTVEDIQEAMRRAGIRIGRATSLTRWSRTAYSSSSSCSRRNTRWAARPATRRRLPWVSRDRAHSTTAGCGGIDMAGNRQKADDSAGPGAGLCYTSFILCVRLRRPGTACGLRRLSSRPPEARSSVYE